MEQTQLLPKQHLLGQVEGALISQAGVDHVLVVGESQQDVSDAVVRQVGHLRLTVVVPLFDAQTTGVIALSRKYKWYQKDVIVIAGDEYRDGTIAHLDNLLLATSALHGILVTSPARQG